MAIIITTTTTTATEMKYLKNEPLDLYIMSLLAAIGFKQILQGFFFFFFLNAMVLLSRGREFQTKGPTWEKERCLNMWNA